MRTSAEAQSKNILESACVAEASEVEGKTLPLKHGERRGVGVAASR